MRPADSAAPALDIALARLERADLVVGIPSFNNAQTIGHVVAAARLGLRGSFAGRRAVILNSDGGSSDGTRAVAASLDSEELPVASFEYAGLPGKGSALRAVFEATARLGARAACVVDSDLRSIRPFWIGRLLAPIVDGRADYVTPLYLRHKHDGTITNTVVYPLVRALYGARVRQPIGGEFGFSRELARAFRAEDVWEGDVARFGIDIFMTTTALARGARVTQAALGAKVHDPKDPAAHLGPMFSQVLGSAIAQIARHRDRWGSAPGSGDLPVEGELEPAEPDDVPVDLARLDAAYAGADADARSVWSRALCADDLARFDELARTRRPADAALARTWARLVFDAVAGSIRDRRTTGANVRALLPLYFARVAAHVRAAAPMDSREAEGLVEEQARAFEVERRHLEERLA